MTTIKQAVKSAPKNNVKKSEEVVNNLGLNFKSKNNEIKEAIPSVMDGKCYIYFISPQENWTE